MEYRLIRSDRRTLAAEIRDGALIVRAPRQTGEKEIEAFLQARRHWIETHLEQSRERMLMAAETPRLTDAQIRELAERAARVIPQRVALYAGLIGVSYGRITIRRQRTKWGSCSSKGNLNFNCLLMLAPPEVLDSVVVHELCHRLEMNHSDRFYAHVLRVYPEYRRWNRWLRDNGNRLMAML